MPLLSKVDAALELGVGMELLDSFCTKCPKPNDTRVLKTVKTEQGDVIDAEELRLFHTYLHSPWPLSPKGTRPYLPPILAEDIRAEAHYECAICGYMDNGEVAHIEEVSTTRNNGPDNLIYLCPNHHTKYDLGYKPSSNITIDVVRAAKEVKRHSRRRMLRYEQNVNELLDRLVKEIARLNRVLQGTKEETMYAIYQTEAAALVRQLPKLIATAKESAAHDSAGDSAEAVLIQHAPTLLQAAESVAEMNHGEVSNSIQAIADAADEMLLELDEVDCPHCEGVGTKGRLGELCVYCHGSCVVSNDKASTYDRTQIDEEECPHCEGRGTKGYDQHHCPYCQGSGIVDREQAADYNESDIVEQPCPHCNGRGYRGRDGHYCPYCLGSSYVSHDKFEDYDPSEVDEADCPHCDGRGQLGLDGHDCPFCHGAAKMSRGEAARYDPSTIDEAECPHCEGRGTVGVNGRFCSYCGGARKIPKADVAQYDRADIDETTCPHCEGSGRRGRSSDMCSYCDGDRVVTKEMAREYQRSQIDEVECPRCAGRGRTGYSGVDECVWCLGAGTVATDRAASYKGKRFWQD